MRKFENVKIEERVNSVLED